jgi:hypothetical protein
MVSVMRARQIPDHTGVHPRAGQRLGRPRQVHRRRLRCAREQPVRTPSRDTAPGGAAGRSTDRSTLSTPDRAPAPCHLAKIANEMAEKT